MDSFTNDLRTVENILKPKVNKAGHVKPEDSFKQNLEFQLIDYGEKRKLILKNPSRNYREFYYYFEYQGVEQVCRHLLNHYMATFNMNI